MEKNIFGQNVIVAINKFNTDTVVELNYLKEELSKINNLAKKDEVKYELIRVFDFKKC